MNYSIPVYNLLLKGVPTSQYSKIELENVLDKTIIISQLSEGGITYGDCENMDTYELEYLCRKLIKLKKEENEIKKKQLEEARQKRG